GLSAAMTLAQKKRNVYLVEKEFVLGGTTVLLDELSPGFECASCFLEPAIDKCLHNENISVLTGTELLEIRGSLGNFSAKFNKKARYVLEDVCIGCKSCSEVCPVETEDEFSFLTSKKRKAIYMPYEGCLPLLSVLDIESCLAMGQNCTSCFETCPFGAINFKMKDEVREINCGAILIATGAKIKPNLTTKVDTNVFNQFQFERMIHPNGPTKGRILKENGEEPKNLVFVLDVNGRKEQLYALQEFVKLAVRSLHIQPNLEITVITPVNPEIFEIEDIKKLPKEKVKFVQGVGTNLRCLNSEIEVEIDDNGIKSKKNAEIVVAYEGYEPSNGTQHLISMLGLKCNENDFIDEWADKFEPATTLAAGIFVAGTSSGFKDVKSSIKDGVAAAGRILSKLVVGEKLKVEPYAGWVDEERCSACGICLSLC
ncbi:MAG: 4Fe-4S binding protein, partial [Acidobacteria bacterium]|nr:4Fe-4S binding protein [Acidobacteriota bacterium]